MAINARVYGLRRGDKATFNGGAVEVIKMTLVGAQVRTAKGDVAIIGNNETVLLTGSIFPSRDAEIKKSIAEKL